MREIRPWGATYRWHMSRAPRTAAGSARLVRPLIPLIRVGLILAVLLVAFGGTGVTVYANDIPLPQIGITVGATDDPLTLVPTLQLFFLVTIITLSPTLILMFTSFTRLIVVLHFMRSAMGTQQMPPNQVLIGLALFLTFFIMSPILNEINDNALIPYTTGQISQEQAIAEGWAPLQRFMMDQITMDDIVLFVQLEGTGDFQTVEDVPARILIPAFILSELTRGFIIGFFLYLPFVAIDMIVASVLMSMGMMMLPPAMISLPFKILLFILGGGWNFVFEHVLLTFRAT